MKAYAVVIHLGLNQDEDPALWNWFELLDLGPGETVEVEMTELRGKMFEPSICMVCRSRVGEVPVSLPCGSPPHGIVGELCEKCYQIGEDARRDEAEED